MKALRTLTVAALTCATIATISVATLPAATAAPVPAATVHAQQQAPAGNATGLTFHRSVWSDLFIRNEMNVQVDVYSKYGLLTTIKPGETSNKLVGGWTTKYTYLDSDLEFWVHGAPAPGVHIATVEIQAEGNKSGQPRERLMGNSAESDGNWRYKATDSFSIGSRSMSWSTGRTLTYNIDDGPDSTFESNTVIIS